MNQLRSCLKDKIKSDHKISGIRRVNEYCIELTNDFADLHKGIVIEISLTLTFELADRSLDIERCGKGCRCSQVNVLLQYVRLNYNGVM